MDLRYYSLTIRRRARLLILACLLLGLVAGVNAGWAYTQQSTENIVTRDTVQSVETDFNTTATVTGDTSLYQHGETVSDRSMYLLYAMPEAELHSETTAKEPTTLQQDMMLELVARGNGDEFWSERIILDSNQTQGTQVSTTADANILEIADRRSQISSELGGSGSVTAKVLITTTYQYEGDQQTKQTSIPIMVSTNTYGFTKPSGEPTRTHTVQQVTTQEITNTSWYIPAAIGSVSLILALVLGIYRYRHGIPTDWELEIARHQDWMSQGRMSHVDAESEIELDSISSVVDMAIDLRKRAIYDPRIDAVLVLDNTQTAYFVSAPDSSWTPTSPYV